VRSVPEPCVVTWWQKVTDLWYWITGRSTPKPQPEIADPAPPSLSEETLP
jgi:hypothetical protein